MPRARPFLGKDVLARKAIAEAPDRLSADAFAPWARSAAIPKEKQDQCREQINEAYRNYMLTLASFTQERPARKVAALRAIEKLAVSFCRARSRDEAERHAFRFFTALEELPISVHAEVGSANLDSEFLTRIRKRITYWQSHVCANRPSESSISRRELWDMLEPIVAEFSSNARINERIRRKRTADLVRALGLRLPDELKDPAKATGRPRRKSRRTVPPATELAITKSPSQLARERRLSKIPL
jgi:hypothetical protein